MARVEYYNNSNSVQQEEPEHKELQKVVTGEIKERKKSIGRKFLDSFFAEDLKSVKSYILSDVIVPYCKNILSEAFNTFLYGEAGRGGSRNPLPWRTNGGVNYTRYYGQPASTPVQQDTANDSYEKLFANYIDADNVLRGLRDISYEYPYATVGDLKMLLGLGTSPVDYSWGWDRAQLDSAQIMRDAHGYYIKYPKPQKVK